MLNAGRVLDAVRHGALEPPANERQARELAPLLDEPKKLRSTWAEVVDKTDGKPTAAQVREVADEDEAREIARRSILIADT